MCGLVGVYSSNMFSKHEDVLRDLLYLDTWRGKDSTGVAALRSNSDTAVLKSTVPGYEFIEHPRLKQHLKLNDFCWIGHNRYGTIGKNIKANAHPFTIDDEDGCCIIVGAHNGTLKNKHVLMDHTDFGTDSEALFNHIANTSLEETIPLVEGAWALTYYDHQEEELRFLRNKERSLHYAYEEGRKTMIWASEAWMIRTACSRNNVKLDEDKVYLCAEDTLYSFPVPLKMNDEIKCERKGGLVGKAPVFFQGGWRAPERWASGASGTRTDSGKTPQQIAEERIRKAQETAEQMRKQREEGQLLQTGSSTQSGTTEKTAGEKLTSASDSSSSEQSKGAKGVVSNVVNILTTKKYKGYGGAKLTLKQLQNQLASGCGWCEEEFIDHEDKHAWLAPGKPVCVKCLTGTHEDKEKRSVH